MREARGIDLKKAQGGETEQKFSGVGKKTSQKILYAAAAVPGKPDTQLVQVT